MSESRVKEYLIDAEARKMSVNTEYDVAMSNDMLKGTSNLSLNEAKFLRLVIMQVKPYDKQFGYYKIGIKDLAQVLGLKTTQSMYREVRKMCKHIMHEVILIGDGNPHHKWEMFHWVSRCKYDNGVITVQLHEDLKPYLLGLKKWFTQYRLEEIMDFKGIYTMRLYELLLWLLKENKPYADKKSVVYMDIKTLRKATGTENKYNQLVQLKTRLIEKPIEEINKKSDYHVTYRDYKEGRKVVGFYFDIESRNTYELRETTAEIERLEAEKQISKQMTLSDFPEYTETIDF